MKSDIIRILVGGAKSLAHRFVLRWDKPDGTSSDYFKGDDEMEFRNVFMELPKNFPEKDFPGIISPELALLIAEFRALRRLFSRIVELAEESTKREILMINLTMGSVAISGGIGLKTLWDVVSDASGDAPEDSGERGADFEDGEPRHPRPVETPPEPEEKPRRIDFSGGYRIDAGEPVYGGATLVELPDGYAFDSVYLLRLKDDEFLKSKVKHVCLLWRSGPIRHRRYFTAEQFRRDPLLPSIKLKPRVYAGSRIPPQIALEVHFGLGKKIEMELRESKKSRQEWTSPE